MSYILKRKSFNEELKGDSLEELEAKRAKMAQNKTPVSLLYEMCTKVSENNNFLSLSKNVYRKLKMFKNHEIKLI